MRGGAQLRSLLVVRNKTAGCALSCGLRAAEKTKGGGSRLQRFCRRFRLNRLGDLWEDRE